MSSPNPALGYPPWLAEVMARAASVDNTLSRPIYTDLNSENDVEIFSTNTGKVTFDVPARSGWANCQTGAVAGSEGGVFNAGGAILVASASGEPWYAHSRCEFLTTPDVNTSVAFIGMQSKTDPNNYVNFGHIGTAGTGTLSLLVNSAGQTYATSTTLIDASAHDYGLAFDFVNGAIIGFMDETEVLRTTDLTNLTSDGVYFYTFCSNGGTAAAQQMYVDRLATTVVG